MAEVTVHGVVESRDGGAAFEYLTLNRGQIAAWGGGAAATVRVVRVPGDYTSDGSVVRCRIGGREVCLDPYTLVTFAQLRLYGFDLVSGDPWRPDEAPAGSGVKGLTPECGRRAGST